MPIPIARTYTAAVSALKHQQVHCESCGTDYVYQVKLRAQGEGVGLLLLDNGTAEKLAVEEAERRLQKALAKAVDVVPCPGCDWIQENMHALARRRHLRRTKMAGVILLSSLVIPLLMAIGLLISAQEEPVAARAVVEVVVLTFLLFVSGVSLLLGSMLACKHFDPNSTDVDARLQLGRARAVLLTEFTKQQGQNHAR